MIQNYPEYAEFLCSSYYFNYNHPTIQKKLTEIIPNPSNLTQLEQIQKIFIFVRDHIAYKVTHEITTPKFLRASNTLARGYGHCVAKAILLATFTRLIGIPTRLHFVDIKNHQLSETWIEQFGEELLWHGYVEIYFKNRWIALNPAYDKKLCERHGYYVVEFDGKNDALFAKTDKKGNLFIEYVADHGVFSRVPYIRIFSEWFSYYTPYYLRYYKKVRKNRRKNKI
ncbi:transglutaminase-like domain-containing protein [Candidatus Harpocratesius sp.]